MDALVQALLEILDPALQLVPDRDVHADQPRDGRSRVALHRDHVVSTGDRGVRELGHALAVCDGSDRGPGLRSGRALRADRDAIQDVPLDGPYRRGDLCSIHVDLYRAVSPASPETGAGPRGSGAFSA